LTRGRRLVNIRTVHVLCITGEPRAALVDPEAAAGALRDLGCRVTAAGLDLQDLDRGDLDRDRPDLVCLDAGDDLPAAYRALGLVRMLPALSDVPVLVVVSVARLPALDFGAGADDFVLRPIVPAELYARVRQLDWRTSAFAGEEALKLGDLVLDLAGYEARLHGRRLDLTHQEFELLKFLAQHSGRVFTREQLLVKVWGYSHGGVSRTVDIHVRRLRAKLGTAADLIVTVRHVGYKMASPAAAAEAEAEAEADAPPEPARARAPRGHR
jgi:DNA-binding response OmpR family regulator